MVPIEVLRGLPLFRGLGPEWLEAIAAAASILEQDNNTLIAHQHDRVLALSVLLDGGVQYLVHVEGSGPLLVGVGREPGLVIGWSVFRAPYRHTTDVRCEGPCRLLRVPHHVLDRLLAEDPAAGLLLLRRVAASLARHLDEERAMLLETAQPGASTLTLLPRRPDPAEPPTGVPRDDAIAALLAESPLFDGLEPRLLHWVAHQASLQSFPAGEVLCEQDRVADSLYVLVSGRVGLSWSGDGGERWVFLRALEGPGDPLGWSALVDPRRYHTTATALEPIRVLAVPGLTLEKLSDQEPAFGVGLMQRVLQILGARLRYTRVRLVARRYERELLAVRSLLEQAAESLPVTSALHKIPYLLENRLTLADAVHALELTRAEGDPTERNVAEMALEVLQHIRGELAFYQGLQRTYQAVANAPQGLPPESVRRRSMEASVELFQMVSHRIAGTDRLPERPGHIVIMNHLENHMDTRLPNDFRLTLDSHFVSSMILYRHYGEPPVRVVRKPELGWYGYQQYFDRLDYIYVYPGEVDQEDQDQQVTREQRNRRFVERAGAHLAAGRNLVIAPEGRCSETEASPGPFKPGAFRLAAALDPEPLIVPVAVANFDKRLTRTTVAAIVQTPFRLSEQVADSTDEAALLDFVNAEQRRFHGYVREAIRLADGE